MSNSISEFYQTLVAAATEASQALVGTNSLMDSIYMDFKPQVADIGETINVNVPVSANLAEAGRQTVEAIRQFERRSGSSWRQ